MNKTIAQETLAALVETGAARELRARRESSLLLLKIVHIQARCPPAKEWLSNE
ncbi:hypothetical protein D3C76_1733260 [compost metagenome]